MLLSGVLEHVVASRVINYDGDHAKQESKFLHFVILVRIFK
jgi:hypothetical protein